LKESIPFQSEEQDILRRLRRHGIVRRPILLAVSGGCDSMFLLTALARLNPLLKNELAVAHIHHGPIGAKKMRTFRDKAQIAVERRARALGLPFFTERSAKALHGENECRDFRWSRLRRLRDQWQPQLKGEVLIATAHHRDDLLETQILRLIRGTSLRGLAGISFRDEDRLRPLLALRRDEIEAVSRRLKIKWHDDPSNKNSDPLRNWLRQKWLPALEAKQRGATGSLARSLATIASSSTESATEHGSASLSAMGSASVSISRQKFMSEGPPQQRQLVARYLLEIGVRDYSQGQIEEIVRRLDNRRGEHKFAILKHEWHVNAEQIRATKLRS